MKASTPLREQPISPYRIIQRHGNGQATIEYADDRGAAQQHVADVGGVIECYIFGVGWVNWCEAMIEEAAK